MRRKLRTLTGAGKLVLAGRMIDVDYRIVVWRTGESRSAEGTISGLTATEADAFSSQPGETVLLVKGGQALQVECHGVQGDLVAIAVNTPVSF